MWGMFGLRGLRGFRIRGSRAGQTIWCVVGVGGYRLFGVWMVGM